MHFSQSFKSRVLDSTNNVLVVSEKCPDGNLCYNGSTCISLMEKGYKSPVEGRTYMCDCSATTTFGTEFYAGYGCEYDATEYCIDGPYAGNGKSISFCTNGKCKENWFPDENDKLYHVGCNCEEGWEGDYCEYRLGEAPYKYTTKKSTSTAVAIGVTVPIIVLSVVAAAIFCRRRNRSVQTREDSSNHRVPNASPAMGQLKADHADII